MGPGPSGGRRLCYLRSSPTAFFAEGAAATLEVFELNDRGVGTAFVVHSGGGGEIRAIRVP